MVRRYGLGVVIAKETNYYVWYMYCMHVGIIFVVTVNGSNNYGNDESWRRNHK